MFGKMNLGQSTLLAIRMAEKGVAALEEMPVRMLDVSVRMKPLRGKHESVRLAHLRLRYSCGTVVRTVEALATMKRIKDSCPERWIPILIALPTEGGSKSLTFLPEGEKDWKAGDIDNAPRIMSPDFSEPPRE